MIDVLSVDNMRRSDAATIAAGTPGRELMARAARGVFESVDWKEPVAIVCGSGNNAGDGYALALLLCEAGIKCSVFCVYDRFSEDGKFYYDKCLEKAVPVEPMGMGPVNSSYVNLSEYKTVVDCLLGTGFKGEPREEIVSVIEAINDSGAYVVSVDINSGLNGDTGIAKTCVKSDLTVSVGSFKPGHFLNMAKDVMKDKVNVDIGIEPVDEPYKLIESSDISAVLGKRENHSNKGTYGYTALIGGSTRYSGAIRLAYMANAAMRSGAGVVKVALPGSLVHDVAGHILESTIFPLSYTSKSGNDEVAYVPEEINELTANVRTVAFGMGIGTGEGAAKILEHLLQNYEGTLIVDADGLTLLSGLDMEMIKGCRPSLILTPHIKEFSRLTKLEMAQIQEDPIGHAREYARSAGAVVLLKGPATIVTDGERVYLIDRGCPGMATAGSGDVLSGIVSAVGAYVSDKCLAAAVAAYINGAAGEIASRKYGDISMIASDTIAAIPEIIA